MERLFAVFLHQIRPNRIVTRLKTRSAEVIGVYSCREPVALRTARVQAVKSRCGTPVSFPERHVEKLVGLTEYAAHRRFWPLAGTQNSVSGPLLMLYITFISCGPRGIWIMNLQKVCDL